MRVIKDLLLYVFFFGMLGFASLSYYLFTHKGATLDVKTAHSGNMTDIQVTNSMQQSLPAGVGNTEQMGVGPSGAGKLNIAGANDGDTTGYRRPSDIMGINTADVKEDTSAVQFINLFKSAIPFYETSPWGSGKDVVYDDNGWPTDLKGGQALTKFLNRLPAGTVPDGFYTVLYDGKGTLHYGNDASLVAHRDGMDIIEIKAGDDNILNASLVIKETDADDYINNIRVLLPGGICQGNPYLRVNDETECDQSQYLSFVEHHETLRYNPDYLNFIKDFKVIRFMNMSGMTRNPVEKWEDRHNMEEATWGGREGTYSRGAPAEIMIDIANRVNADPWFAMPYQANDDYVRNFAKMVKENLKPNLKAYIEYSNEIWNPIFVHHDYAINQGLKLKLSSNKNRARERFHSLRSVQVFDIWEEEFGGTDRLIRVMGAWTSNPRMSNDILSYRDAYKKTDALAIAPYFGATIKEIQTAKTVDDIFDAINDKRSKKGFAASVRQMQQQAKVAEVFDVDLIAYEGGQHLVDWNTRKADDGNNELLYAANRDRRMGELYKKYLKEWEKAGGKMFVQFSAPRIYSWYGSWGIKEYISQPRSEAPKYDAILGYMEEKAGIESPEQESLAMNTATARKGVALKRLTSPDQIWTLNDFWPVYLPNSDPSKPSEVGAKWQAHWDDRNFYLNVSVSDRNVEVGDGVEVVVQIGNLRNRLKIMYGEASRKNTLFTETENGYRITSVLPWEKLSDEPPEAGESIGFDIAIFDVDDEREKKDLFWAERVEEKAGDRKLLTAALDNAEALGHTVKAVENKIPQVTLVAE